MVQANPSLLLEKSDTAKTLWAFLTSIDVFSIWMVFLLAVGFAAYGTYDLTNWSIMKDWPWFLSVADWAWGTFLTAVTSAAGYYIATWLGMGPK